MKHIKLFENFSRDYLKQNNNSLTAFYSGKLSSFNLEKRVLDLLEEFEKQVDLTFSDNWNLNRGRNYGRYNGDYFALNVKVYNWPNPDNIKKKFGIEMDDERLSDIWYQWMAMEAESFEEDLREQYSWIDNISWGGNSGGWLHIYPDKGADALLEAAEDEIQMYLDTKEFYDEADLEEVGKAINNPEWERLAELGLVEDAEEVRKIVESLTGIINWLKTEINNLIGIEKDLVSIQEQHKRFEKHADEYFMDYLKDEIDNNDRFNEEKSILTEELTELQEDPKAFVTYLNESGNVSSEPGTVVKINSNGAWAGSCSLLEFNQANSLDFDVDLYNFIGENISIFSEPTQYIHSMVVEKPHRGNGFSKILLKRIQEIAESAGAKYLTLITDCDNVVAQNLYRGFGFEVFISDGKKALFYKDLPLSNILAKS